MLSIKPIKKHGLMYYGVYCKILGQSALLSTFMSEAGAVDCVNRMRRAANAL